jgi:hypothetical protein
VSAVAELKVLRPVIGAVAVDVVDSFVCCQQPPEQFFHNEAVLGHVATVTMSCWMIGGMDADVTSLANETTSTPVTSCCPLSSSVIAGPRAKTPYVVLPRDVHGSTCFAGTRLARKAASFRLCITNGT